MTTSEVANRFRVSSETIRRWVRDGKLPAIRLGGVFPDSKLWRFNPDVIDRLLEGWSTEQQEESDG
jgi:excisionase family DNA binding protein